MIPVKADLAVVGAGPAGLAAAIEAKKCGMENVVIIEREKFPGGILNQCIHDGFGVIKFRETFSGPEYAHIYLREAEKAGVKILTETMTVNLTSDKILTLSGRSGYGRMNARAVLLSTGCRERTRGALGIPGSRPAGIFTAGVVQHLVNIQNIMVGKKIVILGSGDIGLIMARRLTLEGCKVEAVVEKLPYPSGLPRNITQCLEDYGIPLLLKHTVTKIFGRDRLEGVTISRLNDFGKIVESSSKRIACDTLVLSVGLIPENELSLDASVRLDDVTGGPMVDETMQTSVPGIFSCGNALQVHDLVDHVSNEAEETGRFAAEFIRGNLKHPPLIPVTAGKGIRYVTPQSISGRLDATFSMRSTAPFEDSSLVIKAGKKELFRRKFRRINPAEMLRINLKSEQVSGAENIEVTIDD